MRRGGGERGRREGERGGVREREREGDREGGWHTWSVIEMFSGGSLYKLTLCGSGRRP